MDNLEKWIDEQLNSGYSQDQILQSLLKAGYSEVQARRAIREVLNQRKKNKMMLKQYKKLILVAVFLLIILVAITYYFGSTRPAEITSTTNISKETTTTIQQSSPKISVSREVDKEVNPGGRLGVLLKASFSEPSDLKLYEKLPEGFEIMNDISSMSSQKLDNNVYLFEISRNENTYGIAITYFVKVPSDAKGEYQIEGWYEVNNQKINTESSKFKIL